MPCHAMPCTCACVSAGLTESCSATCVAWPDCFEHFGTVGPPQTCVGEARAGRGRRRQEGVGGVGGGRKREGEAGSGRGRQEGGGGGRAGGGKRGGAGGPEGR
eukprot:365495-Chlamydomonas_euryale.AAC.3